MCGHTELIVLSCCHTDSIYTVPNLPIPPPSTPRPFALVSGRLGDDFPVRVPVAGDHCQGGGSVRGA